jgi:choline-glycine betaine transporter
MKIKKLKFNFKIGAALAVFVLFFLVAGNMVIASALTNAQSGLDTTAQGGYGVDAKLLNTNIAATIGQIVGALLAFVGLIFFILLIYSGFMWMTAGGNEEEVHKAISTIIRASVGLVIIAAAYLLVKFVGESIITQFTG